MASPFAFRAGSSCAPLTLQAGLGAWVPAWVLPRFPQLVDDGVMVHSTQSGVLLARGALAGTSPHGEGGVHHDAARELVGTI